MSMFYDDEIASYFVVINDEEQYSIWRKGKAIPAGWRSVDMEGTKVECLDFIDRVWTDLRPKSLRTRMEVAAAGRS